MITLNDLNAICPLTRTSVLAPYVDPLNAAMLEFGIDNKYRVAAFLAQLCHESGGFRYVHEIASGAAYDDRADLGNTKPEAIAMAAKHGSTPGKWWHGHGLIQITGYDNHLACGLALGIDLLDQPSLLERPDLACRSAGWFWRGHGLNEIADKGDFDWSSDVVNFGRHTSTVGDSIGYKDRLAYYKRAQQVLA